MCHSIHLTDVSAYGADRRGTSIVETLGGIVQGTELGDLHPEFFQILTRCHSNATCSSVTMVTVGRVVSACAVMSYKSDVNAQAVPITSSTTQWAIKWWAFYT